MKIKTKRNKISKIYKTLDSMARKGNSGKYEYYIYLNDLINRSELNLFKEVISTHYGYIFNNYEYITQIRDEIYSCIMSKTYTKYQNDRKSLLDGLSVYQIGYNFYYMSGGTSSIIGTIKESKGRTGSLDSTLAYGDQSLFKIFDEANVVDLIVESVSGVSSSISTIGQPLISKYSDAINFLLNNR